MDRIDMAEAFNTRVLPSAKSQRYAELAKEIASVLEGEPNATARMATVTAMLAQSFDLFFWTGFYLVDAERPQELVIGPYQGTLGCLRIAFGRGVCGTAAAERRTVIVPDVDAFPGHIACDSRSKSEIVVPVFGREGRLLGVLDVDSAEPGAFDETDASGLEHILQRTFDNASLT
jgi:L-methionine (R)-S-oxide reductase